MTDRTHPQGRFPMPIIYDRTDDDDHDDTRNEYDRNAPTQTLTVSQYLYGTAAVCTVILVLIIIANLAAS